MYCMCMNDKERGLGGHWTESIIDINKNREEEEKKKEAFVFISVCYAMVAQRALWYMDQSLRTHSFQ